MEDSESKPASEAVQQKLVASDSNKESSEVSADMAASTSASREVSADDKDVKTASGDSNVEVDASREKGISEDISRPIACEDKSIVCVGSVISGSLQNAEDKIAADSRSNSPLADTASDGGKALEEIEMGILKVISEAGNVSLDSRKIATPEDNSRTSVCGKDVGAIKQKVSSDVIYAKGKKVEGTVEDLVQTEKFSSSTPCLLPSAKDTEPTQIFPLIHKATSSPVLPVIKITPVSDVNEEIAVAEDSDKGKKQVAGEIAVAKDCDEGKEQVAEAVAEKESNITDVRSDIPAARDKPDVIFVEEIPGVHVSKKKPDVKVIEKQQISDAKAIEQPTSIVKVIEEPIPHVRFLEEQPVSPESSAEIIISNPATSPVEDSEDSPRYERPPPEPYSDLLTPMVHYPSVHLSDSDERRMREAAMHCLGSKTLHVGIIICAVLVAVAGLVIRQLALEDKLPKILEDVGLSVSIISVVVVAVSVIYLSVLFCYPTGIETAPLLTMTDSNAADSFGPLTDSDRERRREQIGSMYGTMETSFDRPLAGATGGISQEGASTSGMSRIVDKAQKMKGNVTKLLHDVSSTLAKQVRPKTPSPHTDEEASIEKSSSHEAASGFDSGSSQGGGGDSATESTELLATKAKKHD